MDELSMKALPMLLEKIDKVEQRLEKLENEQRKQKRKEALLNLLDKVDERAFNGVCAVESKQYSHGGMEYVQIEMKYVDKDDMKESK